MLWETWQISQAYRIRPSELLDIISPVDAYFVDRAVWTFGSTVDEELRAARDGAKNNQQARSKQQAVLSRYLNVQQRFRDPAASVTGAAAPGEIVQL